MELAVWAILAGQIALVIPYLYLMSAEITGGLPHPANFYVVSGVPSSGLSGLCDKQFIH